MKRIFLAVTLLAFGFVSRAQFIYSVNETNKLLTAYTTSPANDTIFVFCNPVSATLHADGAGGTAPYTFTWYQYQVNTHQFSTTPFATQSGVLTSSVSALQSGGYKVVVTDAGSNVVGCDIAWVWNLNPSLDAGNTIAGCGPFSLNGTANDNGTNNFNYYNPPAEQLIISAATTISVCFSGTHTWVSDLGFHLVGPASCGSPDILLSPNPGSNGQGNICNSGDNFTNLCFTSSPAGNLDVCNGAPFTLTGTYSSYGNTMTPINWSALYGCDASSGGWIVQVYDCVGGDVGILQNASVTFSGAGTCGANSVTYNSGAINSSITDNSCTAATAASYTVPLSADTNAITVTNTFAYNWTSNPPAAITNANTLNPSVNPNPTVDTWFYLNLSGTYGCNKIDSVFYDYTPAATPTLTAASPVCSNAGVMTLTANPSGGTWSGAGITNASAGTFDPSVSGAGVHIITYTGAGCTGTETVSITVDQAATVAPMSDIVICEGQVQPAITFTASPGGASVNWTNNQTGIGLAASGIGNISSFIAANGTGSPMTATISVTASNAGCTGAPTVFTITINPLPVANAGADTGFCSGTSVTLNGSGGGNYSWLPATNLSNSTIANPVASPPSTTLYTLTVSNGFGCTSTDTVRVTVHPLPAVSGGPNKIICQGSSVQLTASGATTYTWIPASTLNNANISNPTASPTVTTQYTVTGTGAFGCSRQAVVTVIVNAAPVVNAGNDVSVCLGSSVGLAASGTANTYTWSPATGLSNVNSLTPIASPTITTDYILTGIGSNNCTAKDTVKVTVNNLPIAFAGNDTAFCAGTSVQLNAGFGTSYSWTPSIGLSATNVSNPIANPSVQTQYVVLVTDNNGCSKKDSLIVSINPLPNVDGGAAQSICPGGSAQLNASGATTYTWMPASGLSSPAISNPTASPASTTIYTVTAFDLNGCMNFDTVSVTVGTPLAVNAGSNQSMCVGSSVTLNATSAGTTYSWSPILGLSNPNAASTSASPTITTVYSVTASAVNTCPGVSSVTVTVNTLPVINVPATLNLCMGTTQNVNATGALTYTWAPTTGLSNPNQGNTAVSTTVSTSYTVSGTNANGCINSAVMQVNALVLPVIDTVTANASICGSATGSVITGSVSGTAPFQYSLNGGVTNQTSPAFTNLATGNYNVTVTDVNGCKSIPSSAFVGSVNNVQAGFTASPPSGSNPLNVNFTNTSTGANNYNWNFGNTSTSTLQNPASTYTATGTYTVILIAYNNIPTCSDTFALTIFVHDPPSVIVPNIVTPNGDQINDEFFLSGYGISNFTATFYDRWGKKVGEVSGDGATKWNPQDLSDGTYFYVIVATNIDGKVTEHKGHLTILR